MNDKHALAHIKARDLAIKVYELRIKGMRPWKIAETLGCSRMTVYRALDRAVRYAKKRVEEVAERALLFDKERLDDLLDRAWSRMERLELLAKEDPMNGLKAQLAVMEYIRRIMERRAKVFGYDQPTQAVITHEYGTMTGPELYDEAERRGITVSPELRLQLMGNTINVQVTPPRECETAEVIDVSDVRLLPDGSGQ